MSDDEGAWLHAPHDEFGLDVAEAGERLTAQRPWRNPGDMRSCGSDRASGSPFAFAGSRLVIGRQRSVVMR